MQTGFAILDTLMAAAGVRDLRRYAWLLYQSVNKGEFSLKDMIKLMSLLYQKETEELQKEDEDTWLNYTMDRIYDFAGFYAFSMLKKGLLDGRWSYSDGVFTDESGTLSMEEIRSDFDGLTKWADKYNRGYFWIDGLDKSDPDADAFQLAVLDHCTQENSFAAFFLVQYMHFRNQTSTDDLKENQHVWPEKFTRAGLTEEISRRTYSLGRDFLFEANQTENEEAYEANARMLNGKTAMEIIAGEIEFNFWLQGSILFPYTAYMLFSGQMDDFELPERFDDLIDYSQDPSLKEKARHILEMAAAGDPTAQDTLSQMYIAGQDVDADNHRAVYWMKKAADQGVANAQCNYGVALQQGLGSLSVDYQEAIRWFLKAAEQNHNVAQYNLGIAYFSGKGVERNITTAREWFRKAADNGYGMAKLFLGQTD